MNASVIFGLIALGFLWYNLYVSIAIIKYLRSKGENASLFVGNPHFGGGAEVTQGEIWNTGRVTALSQFH